MGFFSFFKFGFALLNMILKNPEVFYQNLFTNVSYCYLFPNHWPDFSGTKGNSSCFFFK